MLQDQIDDFELSHQLLSRHGNEVHTLSYLSKGLDHLYIQVADVEAAVLQRIGPERLMFSVGNDPKMDGVPRDLVTCYFHWYAVSACNFVKMIGWLRRRYDDKAPMAECYLKNVLLEVYVWRNKVAAHFAMHTPHKKDSQAERTASVICPIGWSDDAFYASPLTVFLAEEGQPSSSESIRSWSLTKVHQDLRKRYSRTNA